MAEVTKQQIFQILKEIEADLEEIKEDLRQIRLLFASKTAIEAEDLITRYGKTLDKLS